MSILSPLVRKNAPPKIRKYLKEHGNDVIIRIIVCRTPIEKAIDRVIDWISLGSYSRNKKLLNYDNMFHLFLLVTTVDKSGKIQKYRYEKNHVASVEKTNKQGKECLLVPLKEKITVSEFFKNGETLQGKSFWLYDAVKNNCQRFVMSLLTANGLIEDYLTKFIKQEADQIIDGYVESFSRFVTDIAGVGDVILHGKSLT
jgi:hypothetical protein